MSDTEVRFGIIGAGVAGRYHAQAIAQTPSARLVAVCASRTERAIPLAEAFGAGVEPDVDALLARNDIDAVCICTPSGQHAAQGIAAAQAGKHVLVEKPIATTLADADALIDACRAAASISALRFSAAPTRISARCAMQSRQVRWVGWRLASLPYLTCAPRNTTIRRIGAAHGRSTAAAS